MRNTAKDPLSTRSITLSPPRRALLLFPLLSLCILLTATEAVNAQTVAILAIDSDKFANDVAERLGEALGSRTKVLDLSLAKAAYSSAPPANPLNMTLEEGTRIGAVTGSNAFLIVGSAIQRRSASGRPDYFEAYAVICGVSSRTGRLIYWKLHSFEAPQPGIAADLLLRSISKISADLASTIDVALKMEVTEPDPPRFEEAPDEQGETGIQTPVPYRRLRPEYTTMAALYGIAATVDVMVFLDETGKIVRTETVRWAGFGLDESVETNIRSMNWRPAQRNGKPIAMKFLVRYNFKKIGGTSR